MSETYSSIVAGCQVELEDYDGQLYTPSLLLRAVNLALEEVRLDLTNAGLSDLRKSATITLPAGTTEIGLTTTPSLPADFSAPLELLERKAGSTDRTEWRAVRLVDDLDETVDPEERLRVYSFQEGRIKTRGATVNVSLSLDYVGDIVDFTGAVEALPLRMILSPLVSFTCAHVVRATSPDGYERFRRDGERALSKVRSIGNKRKQMVTALRAARRGRSGAGGLRPRVE